MRGRSNPVPHRDVRHVPPHLKLQLHGDPFFGDASAGPPFDLLVIDEAQRLGEAELIALASRARRWVLVGDAFGFLDPLYSSGVLLALKSGSMAADAVVEGLQKGDTSAAQLGKWEGEFVKGMDRMRRLVCEYYDGFSFGRFVKSYPHFKGLLTDLLIGDLFKDEVDQVVEPMNVIRSEMKAAAQAD